MTPTDVLLPVPFLHQGYNAGCGLAALAMALNYQGVHVHVPDLERHRLVSPRMLQRHGIGPGRIGRIGLTYRRPVTIVDPEPADVGKLFVRAGGRWIRRSPTRRDIEENLRQGIPSVVCIPVVAEAFPGSRSPGSHWVIARGIENGEILIHDPAPWRKADRCTPGYWNTWENTLLAVHPAGWAYPGDSTDR